MNIPFSKPTTDEREVEAVSRVIRSGWMAAGPEVEAFEKEFAKYIGVKYAIFTNSCTSALKMAYKILKEEFMNPDSEILNAGNNIDTVVIPKNTFCATYSAAEEIGLGVEFYNYPKEWEIGDGYNGFRAKVNVHYGGVKDETPCLIEDSAHRIEPNDPLVGLIRCYSFYVTKNMTTGSGGMFVTNDKEIYERARLYWRDGLTTTTADRAKGIINYEVKAMAGGYDGNDIAAAIGRVQLIKHPEFRKRRLQIRDRYNDAFSTDWQGTHLYPYFVSSETEVWKLIKFLKERGISAGYHYPGTGWLGVSLPIYPLLTDEQQEYIINVIKEYNEGRRSDHRIRKNRS